jgi:HD superfamily phosphohydrolase
MKSPKYILDPIHGLMPFEKELIEIMDTPEFQRLREIKQLGASYYCFPSATHSRFSHSLGVSYLAGEFFDKINDPSLDLRPKDRLILQTAGLLHDIGHGPFSHVFENEVMPSLVGDHSWSHEDQGVRIIDHLIDSNYIDIFDTSEVKQIKGMIRGDIPKERKFMSQIIANHQSGIDVDRLDYLQRDAKSVGMETGFNPNLMLTYMSVIDDNICFNAKKCFDVFQFFQTRYTLHSKLYQHSVSKAVEIMIRDIFLEASTEIDFKSMVSDIDMYTKFNDSILDFINMSPGMPKAKALLKRLKTRDLYRLVNVSSTFPEIKSITCNDAVRKVTCHYGADKENPMVKVPFYDSTKTIVSWKSVPNFVNLPDVFSNSLYRIYSKLSRDLISKGTSSSEPHQN